MKKVSILIMEQSLPSGIAGLLDIFKMAGACWDKSTGFGLKKLFDVEIVSDDGKPIHFSDSFIFKPDNAVDDAKECDLIMVPSSGYSPDTLCGYSDKIIQWLREHHKKGTLIASGCTGAFVLAEAGILNGRVATTHWGYSDLFIERFPDVHLSPDKMITEDGNLFCSGGGSAGIDLCLHILERYCGQSVANRCAKILLLERGRDNQKQFSIFHKKKAHNDSDIIKAQNWIEQYYDNNFQIDDLSSHVGMSIRNFKRRFKNATGDSPLVYIQKLRIEAAKKILESKTSGIEEIANHVGYDDVGFFRKLFLRYAGVSPSVYRRKFNSGFFSGDLEQV